MTQKSLESLDLNLLLALHWLLTERNVTAAAGKIGLSQPAMSRALGRLRATFDDPLLIKAGTTMAPTPLGERLQPVAALAVERCRDVLRISDQFDPEDATGRYRIACVDYTGAMLAEIWSTAIRPMAPKLDLEIVNLTFAASRDLVSGKIDLVIMPAPERLVIPASVDIDQFVRKQIINQKYMTAMRRDHPAAKSKLPLKKFAALEHLLVAPEGTRIGIVDGLLEKAGLTRRISYLTSSFLLALTIVQKTDCVITAPEGLLDLDADRLHIIKPPIDLPDINLFAGWHPNWTHDERHQWVRTRLFEALGNRYGM